MAASMMVTLADEAGIEAFRCRGGHPCLAHIVMLGAILALGVYLELDAADDVGRGDACMDAERCIGVADFVLVVSEIADRLGRLEELFRLAKVTGCGGLVAWSRACSYSDSRWDLAS
jgi:hypothetical protein